MAVAAPIVILAEPEDTLALEVLVELGRRRLPAALTPAAALACARAVRHRSNGASHGPAAETVIVLADGDVIASDHLAAVLNRLTHMPAPQFAGAAAADEEYARMELFALTLSWLAALDCPVINRPDARSLSRGEIDRWLLVRCAAEVDLPVRRSYATTSARRRPAWTAGWEARPIVGDERFAGPAERPEPSHLLGTRPALLVEPVTAYAYVAVVGQRVVGEAPEAIASRLPDLGDELGLTLFGAVLARRRDGWCLDSLSGQVAWRSRELVPALADHLEQIGTR